MPAWGKPKLGLQGLNDKGATSTKRVQQSQSFGGPFSRAWLLGLAGEVNKCGSEVLAQGRLTF